MGLTPDQRDLVLTLYDGYMQQVPQLNMGELQRLYFHSDVVRVRNVGNKFEETSKDTYKSEREMSVCEMDSMYQKAVHEEEVARAEVAGSMLGRRCTWRRRGSAGRRSPEPKQKSRRTVGALYCRLVKRISPTIEPAEAAEPPAQQAMPPQAVHRHGPPRRRCRAARASRADQRVDRAPAPQRPVGARAAPIGSPSSAPRGRMCRTSWTSTRPDAPPRRRGRASVRHSRASRSGRRA